MKTNKFFKLAILAFAMVAVISCKDDEGPVKPPVPEIQPPTPAMLQQARSSALGEITQTHTFQAEDGIDFTSIEGAHFTIYPNSMYLNGVAVTGAVTLKFIELYKRGEMLVVNKPLVSNGGPLITGGEFFISVTKDGQQVEAYYQMVVPGENTGGIDPGMTFWRGEENDDGNIEWEEVEGEQEIGGVYSVDVNYHVFGSCFGWINIDILWSLPDPKTPVWVKVPDGYDNTNCSVYVVYKDKPGLAYMDVWDPEKKMFTEHYGLAPIGFNFYVVFLSVQSNGQFVYALKDVVIEEGKIITIEPSDLKAINIDALITLINSLS